MKMTKKTFDFLRDTIDNIMAITTLIFILGLLFILVCAFIDHPAFLLVLILVIIWCIFHYLDKWIETKRPAGYYYKEDGTSDIIKPTPPAPVLDLPEEYTYSGGKYLHTERVIGKLLEEDILFSNSFRTLGHSSGPFKSDDVSPETICLFVNCNDTFAWATGDAENITEKDLPLLLKLYLHSPKWGVTKWVCLHRNLQPMSMIIRDMKADGYWDTELEALPKNNN